MISTKDSKQFEADRRPAANNVLELRKATMTDAELQGTYVLAYPGCPSEWRVKPEDMPKGGKIPDETIKIALETYYGPYHYKSAEAAMEAALQTARPLFLNIYARVVKEVEDMLIARIVELRKAGTFNEGIEAAAKWCEEWEHDSDLAAVIRKLKSGEKTKDNVDEEEEGYLGDTGWR